MDKKLPFDASLFIPIFIGACSICGIVFVLLGLRLGAGRGTVQTIPTGTPIKFQYLSTEPGIAQPTEAPPATEAPAMEEIPTEPSATEIFLPPPTTIKSPTSKSPASTLVLLATNTPIPKTVTVSPLGATYDDADSRFIYTGNWVAQSGVNSTYKNTLHISSTIGDAVQLVFYGQKVQLTYQAGPSLGMVAIKLDSADTAVDQSAIDTRHSEWESPVLSLANHTITITHISGGSINIDSVVIVDISTATPSATATPTP
jgi:hypothetical protein